MSGFNSVDDFLGHSGSSGGGGGKFLKNWKKNGSIRLWLHTQRLPIASWKHSIPQLVSFEDRQTKDQVKAFWGRDMNCWEDEAFLRAQYKRQPDGSLENPPKKCSICRLIDTVAQAIEQGELDWTDEIFRFEGASDSKNNRIIHAGGLTKLFSKRNMTENEKISLKKAGIYISDAWAEDFHAKCQYVLAIVDQDDIGAGIQLTNQPQSVGDNIKRVITDTRASLGEEEGNPFLNPFCIELTYDEKAHMSKKYGARRIEKYKMTAEIERLIYSDPPDVSGTVRPFDQTNLRAFLERYAVVELPWDRIFDVPVKKIGQDDDEREMEFPPKEETPKAEKKTRPMEVKSEPVAPKPVTRRRAAEPEPPPPPPPSTSEVDILPCEKCDYPMKATETTCKKCGAVYVVDDEEEAPQPAAKGKVKGDNLPFGNTKQSRF